MKNIVNCTPHAITLFPENGDAFVIEKSGLIARLSQTTKVVGEINGVNITETQFGENVDLPAPKEGVFIIVSRIVLAANPDRKDLLVPNELVRDENGQILGCKSLARN